MSTTDSSDYFMDDDSGSVLAILKVHGGAIRIPKVEDSRIKNGSTATYRIRCQNMSSRMASNNLMAPKVFVLNESPCVKDKCAFQNQEASGHALASDDLAIFMDSPVPASHKPAYAIDITLNKPLSSTSMEDVRVEATSDKLGTAYLYLDPKYSTQGIQRLQIVRQQDHAAQTIGQIQIEYLIIKNPRAYGVEVPRPEWLSHVTQLDAGHRGSGSGCRADLPGLIAENTVASFNYAARHGADMVELDVMCTSDGIPVIYHNYKLHTDISGLNQIDQLTLKELRSTRDPGVHDKNCKHNIKQQEPASEQLCNDIRDSQLFPTLAEVLDNVDKSCALNIEFKWAQLLNNGTSEAAQYREINDNVDRILDVIYKHADGRHILLSTFNADVAMLLRLKQAVYPVLFLTTGDKERFIDPTTKTIQNAVHFAQAFDMAGINPNVATLTEYLVRYAQSRGLLVYAWGKIETRQAVKELKEMKLNGVIYDKIDLIKPLD